MTGPLATVDLGSHTALLLVCRVEGGRVVVLEDRLAFARLGEGVDATGRLSEEAMARAEEVVAGYARVARTHGVDRLHVVATSATRDAANRDALLARLAAHGAETTVVSGEEEARWGLRGVLDGLPGVPRVTLVDIGGGSTEIATGGPDGLEARVSLDVGSVRLRERCWSGLPPRPAEVDALRAAVRRAVASAIDLRRVSPYVVGVAGTVTSLTGLQHGVDAPDAARLDGRVLSAWAIRRWSERLAALSEAEVLALAPRLLAGRAHLLASGAAILDEVVRVLRVDAVRVSARGLRHGWALKVAEEAGAGPPVTPPG